MNTAVAMRLQAVTKKNPSAYLWHGTKASAALICRYGLLARNYDILGNPAQPRFNEDLGNVLYPTPKEAFNSIDSKNTNQVLLGLYAKKGLLLPTKSDYKTIERVFNATVNKSFSLLVNTYVSVLYLKVNPPYSRQHLIDSIDEFRKNIREAFEIKSQSDATMNVIDKLLIYACSYEISLKIKDNEMSRQDLARILRSRLTDLEASITLDEIACPQANMNFILRKLDYAKAVERFMVLVGNRTGLPQTVISHGSFSLFGDNRIKAVIEIIKNKNDVNSLRRKFDLLSEPFVAFIIWHQGYLRPTIAQAIEACLPGQVCMWLTPTMTILKFGGTKVLAIENSHTVGLEVNDDRSDVEFMPLDLTYEEEKKAPKTKKKNKDDEEPAEDDDEPTEEDNDESDYGMDDEGSEELDEEEPTDDEPAEDSDEEDDSDEDLEITASNKIEAFANRVLASNVASAILAQLGGNRFVAMTGVKNLVSSKTSLQFDLPRSPKVKGGINKISITLNSNDAYDIVGYKYAKLELTKIQEMKDVQASNLKSAFTSMTGYHTSL